MAAAPSAAAAPSGATYFSAAGFNCAITDSGTVVEETAVLQVPSLQMRRATERPQVYDCGSSVKFDPSDASKYPAEVLLAKLEALYGKTWEHGLGDGKASDRIVADLLDRLRNGTFRGHLPENYHLDIRRSYREDGLPEPVLSRPASPTVRQSKTA
jgi:UDP-N-acetylglucosamine 2-epimerase (non-hydrolysing)